MGIQLLALAKLKLVAGGGGAAHGPALILLKSLVWLFVIKVPFAAAISRAYSDVASSSSFFFLFRLTQILFQDSSLPRRGRRWDRAIRLIRDRATNVRHREAAEASFHQLSMVSL